VIVQKRHVACVGLTRVGAVLPVRVHCNDERRRTILAEEKTASLGVVKISEDLNGSSIVVYPRSFKELR
jgi:hypothetical protein